MAHTTVHHPVIEDREQLRVELQRLFAIALDLDDDPEDREQLRVELQRLFAIALDLDNGPDWYNAL